MSELMTCDHVEENINIYQQLTPKTDLCAIPGVGPNMETTYDSGLSLGRRFKTSKSDEMYQQDCILHGGQLDRCVLYVYRLAVYFCKQRPIRNPKS